MKITALASAALVASLALATLATPARAQDSVVIPADEDAVDWRAALESPSIETRQHAIESLRGMGRHAIPVLRAIHDAGLAESSPLWKELDALGRELATSEAKEALAKAGIPGEPVLANVGGFATLAGFLATNEGSLEHWTFATVERTRNPLSGSTRVVVVNDLSREGAEPVIVFGFDDVKKLLETASPVPALAPAAREAALRGRVHTALLALRLTHARAHSRPDDLCFDDGQSERWTRPEAYAIERTETAETLKGISMQLGHGWYDIAFAFGPDGRLDRLDTKCVSTCKVCD